MKIIYTAVFGNYDRIQPIRSDGWRCICFTDRNIKVNGWEIIQMEPYPKAFRHIKTCPHLFLPPHDKSIWMDGNITPKYNINMVAKNKSGYWLMEHPSRDSVWDEAKRCIELKKDDEATINAQMDRYRAAKYPDNMGMVATGVLIRNGSGYEDFGDMWWNEIKNGSVRDQLSHGFCAWKLGLIYNKFPFLMGFNKALHTK